MIQPRHHFTRSATTGDPAEIVGGILVGQAGVGDERTKATGGDTAGGAGGHDIVGAAGGKAAAAACHAVSELDVKIAAVAESPMAAVTVHFQTARGVFLATGLLA